MKGIKYFPLCLQWFSVITLISPLQFALAILTVADTSFCEFEVDREF